MNDNAAAIVATAAMASIITTLIEWRQGIALLLQHTMTRIMQHFGRKAPPGRRPASRGNTPTKLAGCRSGRGGNG